MTPFPFIQHTWLFNDPVSYFFFQDYRDYGLSKKPVQLRTEVLTIDNLKIGQNLEGTVKNVTHFGAFVDIGIGKDALLHQSELRNQAVKLGQRIDISIKTIDKASLRVGLSLTRKQIPGLALRGGGTEEH